MTQSNPASTIDTDLTSPQPATSEPSISFAQSEMKRMKYNPDKMRVKVNLEPDGFENIEHHPVFAENKQGDLVIFFPNLKNFLKTVKDGRTYRPKFVTKINGGVDANEWNYGHDYEGVELFIHPTIANKYQTQEGINHMIMCDDPVCATILCNNGMPALAIPGIQYLLNQNLPNNIIDQLLDILTVLETKKLTYLLPSDILTIPNNFDIDLATRPTKIFNSIWSLFVKIKHPLGIKLFLSYPQNRLDVKRACEIILDFDPTAANDLEKELYTNDPKRGSLIVHDLNIMKMYDIKKIFAIEGGGSEFHAAYSEQIGLSRFIFNRGEYEFDFDESRALYKKSMESAQFICARGTYFFKGSKTNKYETQIPFLDKFPDDSFQKKFPQLDKSAINRLKREIPYYDQLGNRPNNIDYEQDWTDYNTDTNTTTKFYNIYHKLLHKPKKGSIDLSMKFLKHVFGDHDILYKGITYKGWQLGMDYTKILYCNPTHFLPILSLVSEERITGKTTYWDWQKGIFCSNMVKISNADLTGKFTSHFVDKLIVFIEEAFMDKIEVVEKIKDFVTAENTLKEAKGKDAFEIDNFMHVGINSNKINDFAIIDQKEVRFWVRELGSIPGGATNSFKPELLAEIPAFLHHIKEIDYYTDDETRSWFATELIQTEALNKVKSKSRYSWEIELENVIVNYMFTFNLTWCKLAKIDISDLANQKTLTNPIINTVLEKKWNKLPTRVGSRYTLYKESFDPNITDEPIISPMQKRTEHYTFTLSDFIKPHEILTSNIPLSQLVEMEEHENRPQFPFWKNLRWDDFKNYYRFKELSLDEVQLKSIFDKVNSMKEFHDHYNKTFDLVPF